MKTLPLKLKESVFEETEGIVKEKGLLRNWYFNEAIDFYHRYQKRKKLTQAFAKASKLVRESSIEVNEAFDRLIEEGAI